MTKMSFIVVADIFSVLEPSTAASTTTSARCHRVEIAFSFIPITDKSPFATTAAPPAYVVIHIAFISS